jgi:HEAT repeat protein
MKARLVNIALAVFVSALTLAALEGACRLWEWRHPPETVADYLWNWQQRWDGDFYVFLSDAVGWPPWEEFNADGVRDVTHAVEKPEGVRRVVFLGDSVTLGDHIKREEAFPQRLGASFEEEGRPVEVFNVAMLGWSTRQERIAYERIARRYRPDDVVLVVCLNDVAELQNNLARPNPALAALHERSALVRMAVHARWREINSVEELFTQSKSKKVQEAMGRFFAEVLTLREEVRADGASFRMIVLPFRFQVRPNAPRPVVQEQMGSFAAARGIEWLDLLPVLAPLGDEGFVDYDHLSAKGCRRVADEIRARDFLRLPPATPEARLSPDGRTTDSALAFALSHERQEPMRARAARALGRRHARSAVPALFDALRDERAAVRWAAAFSLYEIQPAAAAAVPRLIEAVGSSDAYVRAFATWTLGNLGPEAAAAAPVLTQALSRDDAFAQGGAALALGKIGAAAKGAVPLLVEALSSPNYGRRRAAARALGRIGPDAGGAVPGLLRAATDKDDAYLRTFAVRALGRIAHSRPEVEEALRRAASRDPIPEVRHQAELALRGR